MILRLTQHNPVKVIQVTENLAGAVLNEHDKIATTLCGLCDPDTSSLQLSKQPCQCFGITQRFNMLMK